MRAISLACYSAPEQRGLTKLVGITRAHIAGPQIVNKLARCEEGRIRRCAVAVILLPTLLGVV
jgi:2,4-dienoyl-CoA reductase-like NADH-dependent reductase (Old Yellow Enzyme family)